MGKTISKILNQLKKNNPKGKIKAIENANKCALLPFIISIRIIYHPTYNNASERKYIAKNQIILPPHVLK